MEAVFLPVAQVENIDNNRFSLVRKPYRCQSVSAAALRSPCASERTLENQYIRISQGTKEAIILKNLKRIMVRNGICGG